VFLLLQTVFNAFDANAKAMNVVKVETIGDCYVTATGLPEPQTDHAPRMARLFASKCMMDVMELTRELEVTLGTDTGDLKMRIGIHSGPGIAGVLKGAKTRFQLFGDSMNMAARMEHNSAKNRIQQCSEATAELLAVEDASKLFVLFAYLLIVTRRSWMKIIANQLPKKIWTNTPISVIQSSKKRSKQNPITSPVQLHPSLPPTKKYKRPQTTPPLLIFQSPPPPNGSIDLRKCWGA
jgi:hypothetical protein